MSADEVSGRSETALFAQTAADLFRVVADVPWPDAGWPAVPWSTAPRLVVGFLNLGGRLVARRLRRTTLLISLLGDVTFDLRSAWISAAVSEVNAISILSEIRVILPKDVFALELRRNVSVLGEAVMPIDAPDPELAMPRLSVSAFSCLGDVRVEFD